MRMRLFLSVALAGAALTASTAAQGTWRITVNARGKPIHPAVGPGSERYYASLSHDGRLVAFSASASNVVLGDTNDQRDVFVHDLVARTTTRVSVSSSGTQSDGNSRHPSLSADGRFVAFQSGATNLTLAEPLSDHHVFVHDLQASTTIRVEPDPASGIIPAWGQSRPSISGDGSRVAFIGRARTSAEVSVFAVFVHDLGTEETVRASENADGEVGHEQSSFGPERLAPVLSADGDFVTFSSTADNLVPDDTNGEADVFVYDLRSRVIERISVDDRGEEGNGPSTLPSISADGRFVAFESEATNLVPGDGSQDDVFVRDRLLGTTERVSEEIGLAGHSDCNLGEVGLRTISADGRYVVFQSQAFNLVPGDFNAKTDIFVRDRLHGFNTRLSVDSPGNQVPGGPGGVSAGRDAAISGDGRWVVFQSKSGHLVKHDGNDEYDLFLRRQAPITLVQDFRLYPGTPAQFAVHDARPGETVYFLYSLTGLERRCQVSSGSCIDLQDPIQLLGTAVANAAGTARITASVPPATPSQTEVSTQAVILRGPGRPAVIRSNTHHDRVQ